MKETGSETAAPASRVERATTLAVVGACVVCCAPLLIAAPPLALAGGVAVASGVIARAVRRRGQPKAG